MKESMYSKEVIKSAKKMWKEGFSWRVIVAELGLKNKTAVYYYVNPTYKENLKKATNKWRMEHPEENKKIQTKAIRKYYSSKKGKLKLKELGKKYWQKIKNDPVLHEKEKLRLRKYRCK